MKKTEDLEKWLRETAQSADMKELVEKAESTPLPDELLMRYHAGLLSPEDEKALAPLIALNEENLRFLAEVEGDIRSASELTQPTEGMLSHAVKWLKELWAFWRSPYHALRFAGAVAMIAFAVLSIPPEVSPPGGPFPAHTSKLLEISRGGDDSASVSLPDGTELDRVDLEWPFVQPLGQVESVRWFTWSPLVGKDMYSFRLYSSDGPVVYQRTGLKKPHARLPFSIRRSLAVDSEYLWVVETVDPESRVIRGVGRFTLGSR